MTLRVEVRFEPGALVRANDGLDLEAIGRRYSDALRSALGNELPTAEIAVIADEGPGVRALATGACETENRLAERTARDIAWVVRETVPF